MKIFVTRKILTPEHELFKKKGILVDVWEKALPPTHEELIERSRDSHGIISMLSDNINQVFINQCPNLKVIANYAVGYNNIDIKTAKKNGIQVGNTPDVLTNATADLAMALTLSCSRNIAASSLSAKEGHWKGFEPMGHLGIDLRGKTIGILGAGRIGSCYAQLMYNCFKTKTQYYSRNSNLDLEKQIGAIRCELKTLLATSDIISIHLPLTEVTRYILNSEHIRLIKENAILINTARGEILDQKELVNSLRENKIFAAGLDVTSPEPLPIDHELFQLNNCIITPHIGSASFSARSDMSLICFEHMLQGLAGERLCFLVN